MWVLKDSYKIRKNRKIFNEIGLINSLLLPIADKLIFIVWPDNEKFNKSVSLYGYFIRQPATKLTHQSTRLQGIFTHSCTLRCTIIVLCRLTGWLAGWSVGNFGQIYRHDMHRHHSRGRLLGHSINTHAKRNEKEKSNAKSTNGQEATQTRTRIQTVRRAGRQAHKHTHDEADSQPLTLPASLTPAPAPGRLPLPRSMSHSAIISLLFWFHTYSTHVSASAQIRTYTRLYIHIVYAYIDMYIHIYIERFISRYVCGEKSEIFT